MKKLCVLLLVFSVYTSFVSAQVNEIKDEKLSESRSRIVVTTKTGELIKGFFISQDKDFLRLETDLAGTRTIPTNRIKQVEMVLEQPNGNLAVDSIDVRQEVTDKKRVNEFMEQWHLAAANADSATFFGSMTAGGIYIGTDKTEIWERDEMAEWAKPYFNRDTAWDFTSISREVYFSADGNTAWIHEKLNTWMGVCKGTGILVNENKNWKIALYDLSVTIDNKKIDDFLELTKDE